MTLVQNPFLYLPDWLPVFLPSLCSEHTHQRLDVILCVPLRRSPESYQPLQT